MLFKETVGRESFNSVVPDSMQGVLSRIVHLDFERSTKSQLLDDREWTLETGVSRFAMHSGIWPTNILCTNKHS